MFEEIARQMIDWHFVEGLPPVAFARLQRHMARCSSCRRYYDRLFGFEVRMDGGRAEVDRIKGLLIGRSKAWGSTPPALA